MGHPEFVEPMSQSQDMGHPDSWKLLRTDGKIRGGEGLGAGFATRFDSGILLTAAERQTLQARLCECL